MSAGEGPSRARVVWLLAGFAVRAAMRQRVFSIFAALAFFLVLGSLVFRAFEFGEDELGFLADFGFGVIFFFGSILAILLGTLRWFDEVGTQTALPVLARPVTRGSFFLGQWLGVAVALGAFVAGISVVLLGLLLWRMGEMAGFRPDRQTPGEGLWLAAQIGLAALVQAVRLWVIAAFVFLLGSFSRGALFTATLSFLVVLIGQLMPVAASFERAMTTGVGQTVFSVATAFFPNLGAFALDGRSLLEDGYPVSEAIRLVAYGALYTAVYLGLGRWLFARRDL